MAPAISVNVVLPKIEANPPTNMAEPIPAPIISTAVSNCLLFIVKYVAIYNFEDPIADGS